MEKRSRLGRGLSSLLNPNGGDSEQSPTTPQPLEMQDNLPNAMSDNVTAVSGTPELLHVELFKIRANPNQPRKHFDPVTLAALVESVKVAGVIQPILARAIDDYFEVIAGERRWRAAKLAGLNTIPVIVKTVDAANQAQIALIENIHRQDLNPLERANAYQEIIQTMSLTQAELAARLGEERSSVGHYLRLLDLPEMTRNLILEGTLSLGHAKLLTALDNPFEIDRLAGLVVTQTLSVRALETLIKQGVVPTKASDSPQLVTPHIVDLERRISRDLSMRVEVKQAKKGGKGRLVLHYASLDQFDELLNRLGIKVDD